MPGPQAITRSCHQASQPADMRLLLQLMSLSADSVVKVWDLRNQKCLQTIGPRDWGGAVEDSRPTCLAYDASRLRLVSAVSTQRSSPHPTSCSSSLPVWQGVCVLRPSPHLVLPGSHCILRLVSAMAAQNSTSRRWLHKCPLGHAAVCSCSPFSQRGSGCTPTSVCRSCPDKLGCCPRRCTSQQCGCTSACPTTPLCTGRPLSARC